MRDLDGELLDATLVFRKHFGPVKPMDPPHRWSWRAVPFGACVRCRWLAHTLAPNGVPFHAFCWGNPDPVSGYERWMLRKAREEET
jgi:hypothetical protein